MHPDGDCAYGCIFCITGRERLVAESIGLCCPEVAAIVARQEKYQSVQGKKHKVESVLMPGYVFFRAPVLLNPAQFPHSSIIRVLRLADGSWRLCGDDEKFARWLFSYNGLLSFSKAICEGTRVRIVSGPLKDMEGQIKSIDRRGRSGKVTLVFNHRETSVWLGFDLLETVSSAEGRTKTQ